MNLPNKKFKQTLREGMPIFLIGVLLIALTDSIGSVLSRKLNFSYTSLYPISYLIFAVIPFFIAKKTNVKTAITYAALLGLFDASIGWWISIVLNANIGHTKYELTVGMWIFAALYMMIVSAFLGLLGALIATIIYKKR